MSNFYWNVSYLSCIYMFNMSRWHNRKRFLCTSSITWSIILLVNSVANSFSHQYFKYNVIKLLIILKNYIYMSYKKKQLFLRKHFCIYQNTLLKLKYLYKILYKSNFLTWTRYKIDLCNRYLKFTSWTYILHIYKIVWKWKFSNLKREQNKTSFVLFWLHLWIFIKCILRHIYENIKLYMKYMYHM